MMLIGFEREGHLYFFRIGPISRNMGKNFFLPEKITQILANWMFTFWAKCLGVFAKLWSVWQIWGDCVSSFENKSTDDKKSTWRTKWQTCFRETRRIVKCFTADYFLTLLSSPYCFNLWRIKKLRWQREHQHRIHFHNVTLSESESPALAAIKSDFWDIFVANNVLGGELWLCT